MKSPRTKFVVISAIGLAFIVGIFVLAQSPVRSTSGHDDLPIKLVMGCTTVDKTKLNEALGPRPKKTYRFKYENESPVGELDNSSPPACTSRFTGNATQRAKFANTTELHTFLTAAGL
jgi:hypothetical protein